MDFSTDLGQTTKLGARLTVLAMAIALSACGGGGGASDAVNAPSGNNNGGSTNQPAASQYALTLSVDKQSINISGDTVTITATAREKIGAGSISGQRVQLILPDPIKNGLSLAGSSSLETDDAGQVTFVMSLKPNSSAEQQALLTNGLEIEVVLTEANGAETRQRTVVNVVQPGTQISPLNLDIFTDKQVANVNGDTVAVTLRVSDSNTGGVAGQRVILGIPSGLSGVLIDGASESVTDSSGNATFNIKIAEKLTAAEVAEILKGISLVARLVDTNGAEKVKNRLLTAERPSAQYGLSIRSDATSLNVFGDEVTISVQAAALNGASVADQSVTVALGSGTPTGVQFTGNTSAVTNDQGVAEFKLKLVAGLSQQAIDTLLSNPIAIGVVLTERTGAQVSANVLVPVVKPAVQNSIRLDVTKNALIATGDSMQVIATVLDKNNGAVAGQNVTLRLEATNGVSIEGSATVQTDAKGLAVFDIRLNDKLSTGERDALVSAGIKVTATLIEASGASIATPTRTIVVSQAGTSPLESNLSLALRLSQPQINVLGDQVSITMLASTPQGIASAGQSVTISLPALAGLSLTSDQTVKTSATGQATFNLQLSNELSTAERAALLASGLPISATLTEANGATKTVAQTISAFEPTASYQLSLVSSANPMSVRGDTATVSLQVLDSDLQAIASRTVKVWLSAANNTASLLSLNGQPANLLVDVQTNAQGIATYQIAVPTGLNVAQRNSLLQGINANAVVIEQSGARNVLTQVLSVAEPTSDLVLGTQVSKQSVNAAIADSFDVMVSLKDAEGKAVSAQQLSFAVSDVALRLGVSIAATTATTNNNGNATFKVNTPAGLDVATLKGLLSYAVSLSSTNGAVVTATGTVAVAQPTARYALRLNADKIVKTSGDTFKVFAQAVDASGMPAANQRVQLLVNDPIRTGVTVSGDTEIVTDANGLAVFDLTLTPGANVDQQLLTAGIGLSARMIEDNGVQSRQALIVPVDTLNTTGQYLLSWTQSKQAFNGFGDEIELTYRVTDANGGILAGVPVALRIQDSLIAGATLTTSSRLVTDANGLIMTTVRLTGRDLDAVLASNIVVLVAEVQAASFDAQGVATVTTLARQSVSLEKEGGAEFTIESSRSVMRAGESTIVTAELLDAEGAPVMNAPVEFVDAVTGVPFALGTLTTGQDGTVQASIAFSQMSFGADGRARISAIVRGSVSELRATESIEIVSASDALFSFIDLPSSVSSVDTSIPVTVRIRAPSMADLKGELVLSSSLGRIATVSGGPFTSNQVRVVLDGTATDGTENMMQYRDITLYVSSGFPGTAVLTGTYQPTGQAVDRIAADIRLRATTPAKMMLQADQTVLVPNQTTRVVAIVKDANDSPVSGAVVRFERLVDTSAGRLSASIATTNDAGVATVTYTAGSSAPLDRVEINASIDAFPTVRPQPSALVLTVAQQAAYITVGNSDRLIPSDDNIYYYHPYSMAVIDGSGRPVVNQAVSVQLFASNFAKGFWQLDRVVIGADTVNVWNRYNYQVCATEDQNRNFTLDLGEDFNGNGRLEVANPVAIISGDDVVADVNGVVTFNTDAEGKFDFQVRYPKIYSQWMSMEVKATTRVFGSEMASVTTQGLPVAASDVSTVGGGTRPNILSPFGIAADCSSAD